MHRLLIFIKLILSLIIGTGFTESTHETGKSYTQGGAIGLERATAGHMNGILLPFLADKVQIMSAI